MTRYFAFFFISVLFTLAFAHHSISKPLVRTESVVHEYKKFETALNQDLKSLDIAKFLHDFVAQDAHFTMQVLDEKNQKADNIDINKAAYINSFLNGRKYLESYTAEIKNVEILSQDPEGVTVKHRMIETGMTKLPSKALQPFTSITDCSMSHTLKNDMFVITGGECSTQIALNEDI